VTFEGDNTVMAQQSARFLMKLYEKVKKGKLLAQDSLYAYLNNLDTLIKKKCVATKVESFT
jgi:hypothetical protein